MKIERGKGDRIKLPLKPHKPASQPRSNRGRQRNRPPSTGQTNRHLSTSFGTAKSLRANSCPPAQDTDPTILSDRRRIPWTRPKPSAQGSGLGFASKKKK